MQKTSNLRNDPTIDAFCQLSNNIHVASYAARAKMPEYITSEKFKKAGISIPVFSKIKDFLSPEETITIEWLSPNYSAKEITILWGLLQLRTEKGEKKTFIVRGKPGFCAAVIEKLQQDGKIVKKIQGSEWKDY